MRIVRDGTMIEKIVKSSWKLFDPQDCHAWERYILCMNRLIRGGWGFVEIDCELGSKFAKFAATPSTVPATVGGKKRERIWINLREGRHRLGCNQQPRDWNRRLAIERNSAVDESYSHEDSRRSCSTITCARRDWGGTFCQSILILRWFVTFNLFNYQSEKHENRINASCSNLYRGCSSRPP